MIFYEVYFLKKPFIKPVYFKKVGKALEYYKNLLGAGFNKNKIGISAWKTVFIEDITPSK